MQRYTHVHPVSVVEGMPSRPKARSRRQWTPRELVEMEASVSVSASSFAPDVMLYRPSFSYSEGA